MPETAALSLSPDALHNTGGVTVQEPSDAILHMRALADMRELRIPFVTPQLYELENGDLLIKDAPLLAEGEWTDSAVQTPLYYTAKALQEYAGNWKARTGYNRHLKGVHRDESNRVSEAINPHYGQFQDDSGYVHNAVISDILVYGATPSGRAMQELVKRKQIKYLSVEHGGEEWFNPDTQRTESKTLEFYGYAHVNKGACKVCRVNEAPPEPQIAEVPVILPEVITMAETKELEAQIAAKDARIKELEAAQKPVEVKAEIPRELSDKIAAMEATIKELSARPAPAATAAPVEQKELGAVELTVNYDKRNGTIRQV